MDPPPTKQMSHLARQTLDYVNNIRTVLDYPITHNLHSGVPGSAEKCPIARSIPAPRVVVGMETTQIFDEKNRFIQEFQHPKDVAEFQRRFDRGQISEYVKRKELSWLKTNQPFLCLKKT